MYENQLIIPSHNKQHNHTLLPLFITQNTTVYTINTFYLYLQGRNEVMFSPLSVCLSVCLSLCCPTDYSISYERILLKCFLEVVVGHG